MNYFSTFWYICLLGILYLVVDNYDALFEELRISALLQKNLLRIFWILPMYLINEIIFSVLVYQDRVQSKVHEPKTLEDRLNSLSNCHVIVPTYNVNVDEFRPQIQRLTTLFGHRVWIADNRNGEEHSSDLKNLCDTYGANYCFYNVANKTNAIVKTLSLLYGRDDAVYVVLLDDDTEVPENFFLRLDLFHDASVAGYCCNIEISKSPKYNFWENWIDFEYRTISFRNSSRNFHSLRFLHGIISVYKLESAVEIFRWNRCKMYGLPFGEDAFAGITARTIGYKLKQDHLNTVKTYCPNRLFQFSWSVRQGYNASSLFKQRALRWYLSWPRRILHEIGLCFFYDVGTWIGNIFHRLDFLYYCFLLMVSVGWIYYLLYLILFQNTILPFLYLHLAFFGMTWIMSYIRLAFMEESEKHDVHHLTILTFPLFLLTLLYLYATSFLISLLYYIPFFRVDYQKCFQENSAM